MPFCSCKKSIRPGPGYSFCTMEQDPWPIPDNTKGTVWHVDDIGQIHCRFDTGFGHTLVPGVDHFRKLTEGKEVEHQ